MTQSSSGMTDGDVVILAHDKVLSNYNAVEKELKKKYKFPSVAPAGRFSVDNRISLVKHSKIV